MIQEPIKELEPQQSQISPSLQFLTLIGITIALIIVGIAISAAIIIAAYGTKTYTAILSFQTQDPHFLSASWILQIVSMTIPLFFTPILFARFIVLDTKNYLKLSFSFAPLLLLLVFCISIFSSPVMEVLVNINQKLVLPNALKGLEQTMRNMEQQAQKTTEVLLAMKTIWDMLFAVLVVGLLTALAEEFLFRGALQTILIKWTKNTHAAIWITAILFSAFHLEFFTFLPRFALGVLFGYFVAWSGSIWPSVWAHFLNNGSQVVILYLYHHKTIKLNPDDQHVFNYTSYAFSLIIILFLLFIYRNTAQRKLVSV